MTQKTFIQRAEEKFHSWRTTARAAPYPCHGSASQHRLNKENGFLVM